MNTIKELKDRRDTLILEMESIRLDLAPFEVALESPECGFHAIRTLSPPTSGHSFHAHSDRQSERSDAGLHC